MNAKKAKALRKLMKNMAAQKPEGSTTLPEVAYREITSRAKYIMVQGDEIVKDADQVKSDDGHLKASSMLGQPQPTDPSELAQVEQNHVDRIKDENKALQKVKISTGQIIVDSNSKRAVYMHLKRELTKVEKSRRA